jgi:hypothetical protein
MKQKILFTTLVLFTNLFAQNSYYEFGKKVTLTPLLEKKSTNTNLKYYINEKKETIGIVSNELIVKCDENTLKNLILNKYNIKETEKLGKDLYLLRLFNSQNIFELANILYENKTVEFAIPNTIKNIKKR